MTDYLIDLTKAPFWIALIAAAFLFQSGTGPIRDQLA